LYVNVSESEKLDPRRFKEPLPDSVLVLLTHLEMTATANFDSELQRWAVQVNHIRADTELPPKLLSADLTVLEP
jgi:hypothetical protein